MIHVALAERSYDIAISAGRTGLGEFVRQRARGSAALVVHDSNVTRHAQAVENSLCGVGFQVQRVELPAGEKEKCLATISRLYDVLADLRADRQTLVVAVGGGVIGDLAGFVAATFNRGLPFLQVPTSLLAMVDSSVGGKVGINHPRAKNLIGAFHQPIGVWIDTTTLETLPQREYVSGLAEVSKYGVILDAELFAYLESHIPALLARDPETVRHIVGRSCELKADVVRQDEREETGLRAVLNYGHTFAHAFEAVAGYGTWLHGEAVAAGMICASRLAERLGRIGSDVTNRQRALLEALRLPTRPESWPVEDLLAAMRNDKKNVGGQLRLVLPSRLGACELVAGVSEDDVAAVLGATWEVA
jgi:3-dehydroquinate synthase